MLSTSAYILKPPERLRPSGRAYGLLFLPGHSTLGNSAAIHVSALH